MEGTTTLRPNLVAGVPLTTDNWQSDPMETTPVQDSLTRQPFSVPGSPDNPALATRRAAQVRGTPDNLF